MTELDRFFDFADNDPLADIRDWMLPPFTRKDIEQWGECYEKRIAMNTYDNFLESKRIATPDCGIDVNDISPVLFDFQKDIVKWALKKGRAALFTMTGTGKTLMQLEWARQIADKCGGDVLILAPLAVSHQTIREAKKIGLDVHLCRSQEQVKQGVNIANYEMLHKFDASKFIGIVLDESGLLKDYSGTTRNQIIDSFKHTPYKLACTATPAPNDYMELGNHAEFLGVMSRTEMLSMFFVHDGGETSKWRLKGHAESKYWEWLASWSVVLTKPFDLGYEDDGFILPPLNIKSVVVDSDKPIEGMLFALPAQTLMERRQARRSSTEDRVKYCADIVNSTDEHFLVWCDLNYESELLTKAIPGAVEIRGSHDNDYKERNMLAFSNGDIRVLVTKPSIAGHGMNWQHCSNMAFVGLSDSFEQYFQAVRRCWRFGQKKPVTVHVITSELEGEVVKNIARKEDQAMKMIAEMVEYTKSITSENIRATVQEKTEYKPTIEMRLPVWLM